MDRSRPLVVIPCHNEAVTLGPVVATASRWADVLVVDDRSTDHSADVARAAGADVVPSDHPGYDGALTTGLAFAWAQGREAVVTLDADGEHDPDLVPAFTGALAAGAELVCGRRVRRNRLSEHILGLAGEGLMGVADPLCGMKGYSGALLARWFASGLALRVNMAPMMLSRMAGQPFAQVTVTGTPRHDAPRFGRALHANLALLRSFAQARAEARRVLDRQRADR